MSWLRWAPRALRTPISWMRLPARAVAKLT